MSQSTYKKYIIHPMSKGQQKKEEILQQNHVVRPQKIIFIICPVFELYINY